MSVAKVAVVAKGILTRAFFAIHSIISVWRVVVTKDDPRYWVLLSTLFFLFIEGIVTLKTRKGGEWKWFSPTILIYLASVVPSLFISQLDLLYARKQNGAETCQVLEGNTSSSTSIGGIISVSLELSEENWVLALQQMLLCILIVGRWLLPKGEISRDQLSQLLLVYVGMAADILEFNTEGLKEDTVRCNETLVVLLLSVWAWSLLQFTLVLTATKARKPRIATDLTENENDKDSSCLCCETEVWGITTTIVMQDGPFIIVRLLLMIKLHAVHQMMLFFTIKNALVLTLQIYRLVVLYVEKRQVEVKPDEFEIKPHRDFTEETLTH